MDRAAGSQARRLRDRAILVLGFALGARRSELAALDLVDITGTEEGLQVLIRTSKTDKESKGRTVAVPYGSHLQTCPIRTTLAWVTWLQQHDLTSGPLFRRIDRHGVVGRAPSGRGAVDGGITGQAVAIVVAKAAAAAGLDPKGCWSGHSLRRGFATESYRTGGDPLRIARHGGWSDGSSTLLGPGVAVVSAEKTTDMQVNSRFGSLFPKVSQHDAPCSYVASPSWADGQRIPTT